MHYKTLHTQTEPVEFASAIHGSYLFLEQEMKSSNAFTTQMRSTVRVLVVLCLLGLPFSSVIAMPGDAKAVTNFSLERYLGKWYEVARLDHRFERGLSQVTATYSMRDDGGVRVMNHGYKKKKSKWSDAEGKAYLVETPDIGRLKVSFFGPFYGAYNIIELDQEDYSYALIIGNNTKYMWILAREPELDPVILEKLLKRARDLGFATDELIYPQKEQHE